MPRIAGKHARVGAGPDRDSWREAEGWWRGLLGLALVWLRFSVSLRLDLWLAAQDRGFGCHRREEYRLPDQIPPESLRIFPKRSSTSLRHLTYKRRSPPPLKMYLGDWRSPKVA